MVENAQAGTIVETRIELETVFYAYTLGREGMMDPALGKPTTEKEEDDALE